MVKKSIVISYLICVLVIGFMCFGSISFSDESVDYISPEEFFTELYDGLGIDISDISHYGYCSQEIGYLVHKGWIDSYQAHCWTTGEFSTNSLLDNALNVCGIYQRPLDVHQRWKNTKQAYIDLGILPMNCDWNFTEKLTYEKADYILEKLISKDYNEVKYVDENSLIKYELEEFEGMEESYNLAKSFVESLPKRCIDEINKQNYTLRIVDFVQEHYPDKNTKNVAAFIRFDTNEIYIQDNLEDSFYHEVGHLMVRQVRNFDNICSYLMEVEGDNADLFPFVCTEYGSEEMICDIFTLLLYYQDNDKVISKFQERCPKIYYFINDCIFNSDTIGSKITVNMSQLKKVGN